jgi:hypothetical protein
MYKKAGQRAKLLMLLAPRSGSRGEARQGAYLKVEIFAASGDPYSRTSKKMARRKIIICVGVGRNSGSASAWVESGSR